VHALRELLHVLVGRRVGPGVPQVRLDVLYRSHLLCLGRHRPSHHLEVQLRNPKILGQWLEDPETIVVGIHETTIGVREDERFRRRFPMRLYARNTLRERDEMLAMARAVHLGDVPPLRLGFSSFINANILQAFRESYEEMFPGCEIQLAGGDPVLILQRLNQRRLDCAILPMPIDAELYNVQQIAQSPLVVCMRSDDSLASEALLDIHKVADRIKIFRDPELHPSAHSRLVEMFSEVGIPLRLANSARAPSDIQWMVKAGYGLALVDQLSPLESGLITRPIAGVNWTADTAFVHQSRADHVALPFIERFLQKDWKESHRKKRTSSSIRPEQLKLLA